ncbi:MULTISPECIES: glycosyltransferase [unclassified Sulfitobacter]|uniref:glycosyltransferase n=1 Tax=unclassified Sulfitobacter TaxID=196795 RepID=UPI003746042B
MVNDGELIRVVHVVPTLGMGGTEKNGVRLARFLDSHERFENRVISVFSGDERMRESFEGITKHSITVLPPKRLHRLREFYRAIKIIRPGAVVFHFFNVDQSLLAMMARWAGAKRIVAAAGTAATDLSVADRLKWIASLSLNRITDTPIISASHWIEKSLKDLGRLPARSRVVYNGIDLQKFAAFRGLESGSKARSSTWTLGMIARLEGAKDHAAVMRGFRRFADLVPEAVAELRVIGDGPLRQNLEDLAIELKLSDRISFLGTRMDVPEQLAELDTFVFATTRREGFGNVLVEALAAGVPVIANDVPSSKEVLRNGDFGELVPGSDADAWGQVLARRWRDHSFAQVPNVAELEDLYGISQFCGGYLDVLGFRIGREDYR